MARPRGNFPTGMGAEAHRLMKNCSDSATVRRLQAVYLAAEQNLPNQEIAKITGLSINTIRVWHVRVRRKGLSVALKKPKGGRYRQHLSPTDEAAVLEKIIPAASRGGMVVVSDIKKALESAAGRTYHLHSVYRLLSRRGWRKVSPRRLHPDQDPESATAFKKSGEKSLRDSARRPKNADELGASFSKTKLVSGASATRVDAGHRAARAQSSKRSTFVNTPTSSPPSTRSRGNSPRSSTPRSTPPA